MTALAGPKPTLDPSVFGRRRDDRAPLLIAAAAALLLHALAILIPLPDKPQPPIPRPPVQPPRHVPLILQPPETPEPPPPPVEQPAPQRDTLLVPFEIPEQLPVIEPAPVAVDPVDVPIVPFEPDLDSVVPPPPLPDLVDSTEPGLTLPVAIFKPDPDYPEMGIRFRQEGRIVLRAVIDNAGNVGEIEVLVGPEPDLGFRAAAIDAVRQWRYQPGELRGRTVAVRMTVVVDFSLN